MKKTTAHGRRLQQQGGPHIDPFIWIKAIHHCTPHDDDAPSIMPLLCVSTAGDNLAEVHGALAALQAGTGTGKEFNILASELGKASMRATKIAGTNRRTNPMIDVLSTGNEALRRVVRRFNKWGKWQLDPAASSELGEAVELYETIFQASSPAQMTEAQAQRDKALKLIAQESP